RNELMHRHQRPHEVIDESLVAAYISRHTKIVKRHEDAIRSHKSEPEMDLAQGFVHHPACDLGEPEVSSGKNSEQGGDGHHQMEVADYEVGRVQHELDRRLGKEEPADTAANEHGDKSQCKQRSRVNT